MASSCRYEGSSCTVLETRAAATTNSSSSYLQVLSGALRAGGEGRGTGEGHGDSGGCDPGKETQLATGTAAGAHFGRVEVSTSSSSLSVSSSVSIAAPGGGVVQFPRDMTQLVNFNHHNHHNHHQSHHHHHNHHHHHHHPHNHHQHHHPSSLPSGVVPSAMVPREPVGGPPGPSRAEPRKARRAGGAKSTYKHVPHREKAPHLVARRNARERRRVQAVNTAFVRLRRHVPHENRHKRLSKVKTLHFAIDYINYMQRLIHEYDAAVQRSAAAAAAGHGGGNGGGLGIGHVAGGGGASGQGGHLGGGHHHGGGGGGGAPPSLPPTGPPTIDMVELNSTKENRWMPVSLTPGGPAGGDGTRSLYLPDAYDQYHQG